ncbi:MAG: U32 family peptidase C-terminal domain-containing protein, partial [Thermodesulfovibrionales bacterium]|nr:U32 family peptidase C-terminal domain-containing protein [Thermodesulfovibrionales bacterium]
IRDAVSLELEVFVRGSICLSYSGRCYISSFLAYRSANLGLCTNSCRWNYTLMEEKRPGEYMPVFEDDRGTYLMSSRDLCMIEHIDKLYGIGIDSFKIEGRIKGVNYVGGVIKVYREAIDSLKKGAKYECLKRWKDELNMFSSRGYTTGMFFGQQPVEDYNFDGTSYIMTRELVGIVQEVNNNRAKILMRNRLDIGEKIEFLTPNLEGIEFEVQEMTDLEGMDTKSARNEDIIYLNVPKEVRPLDIIRKKAKL